MDRHNPARPTRRLFVAIVPPLEVRERLAGLTALLDAHRAILRPVRPEGLHITLRFLGELTLEQEEQTIEACAAAVAVAAMTAQGGMPRAEGGGTAQRTAAFPIVIGGFGVFPHARGPRVVWLGLRGGAGPLIALQRRLDGELRRHGVVSGHASGSGASYTPHLTLARVRAGAAPPALAALGAAVARLPADEQARCTVSAISLVHSLLSPRGSAYAVLDEWRLRR